VSLAGDSDRERTAAWLREQFVRGRLTLDELSARVELALGARTQSDLRRALAGLPSPVPQALARGLIRGALLVVLTGAWLLFSFLLLVLFGLVALIHGVSAVGLAALLVVWLVPTYLLSREWRRGFFRSVRGT
jgi:Flp pilus assembly protein TadB